MLSRARVMWLGLLAMLLVGAFASAPAFAGGPFWYHREAGKQASQAKIAQQKPETFTGKGEEQKLKGTLVALATEITSKSVETEGEIYNNQLQGQIKVKLLYIEPKLVEPKIAGCEVKVGQVNHASAIGHLAWTWNGEPKQLKEQPQWKVQSPDIIFTPKEIQQGAKELPKGVFSTVTLSNCGVLNGTFNVEGSTVGTPIQPEGINAFSTSLKLSTPEGKKKQHFFNGTENVGVETGLIFGGNSASLVGTTTNTIVGGQEVGMLEN